MVVIGLLENIEVIIQGRSGMCISLDCYGIDYRWEVSTMFIFGHLYRDNNDRFEYMCLLLFFLVDFYYEVRKDL